MSGDIRYAWEQSNAGEHLVGCIVHPAVPPQVAYATRKGGLAAAARIAQN